MDKNELKEARKEYKKAKLFQDAEKVEALEQKLHQELGDAAWGEFEARVEEFLKEVKALADEVDAKARDRINIMTASALKQPYLEKAKELGGGAQVYIQKVFDEAVKEREAIRMAEKKALKRARKALNSQTAQAAESRSRCPQLPGDWAWWGTELDGVRIASKFGSIMYDYCRTSLWDDCESKFERLRTLESQARRTAWSPQEYDNAMSLAHAWLRFAVPAAKRAVSRWEDTPEQSEVLAELGRPLQDHVKRQRQRHQDWVRSKEARESHKVEIQAVTSVVAPVLDFPGETGREMPNELSMRALTTHPNDVTTLEPGSAWTVYLDESFRGGDEQFETGGGGVMAGVVCRDDRPLPPLPRLHCSQDFTEESLVAQDNALKELLQHPNCGVFAIPSSAYEVAMGWDDVLASWVDVMLRLLPFPEGDGIVSVRICVEPHDPYRTTEDFRALKLVCEKSLKDSFPERARRVKLSFEALPKPQKGELSCNAYPDIIGFTCLRTDNTAKQRYAVSGWSGVCHLDMPPKGISRLLRCFYRSELLDDETWGLLASNAGVGLVDALAARFGDRVRRSAEEWECYLGYLITHLQSGAIDMKRLRRQVAWLRKFQPPIIAKKSQLAWFTAQIALANHEGKLAAGAGSPLRVEFDALCEELYDESAPLVCEASLNLAVAYTNGYEFEMALALIQSLLGRDRATVGLSGYGKLLSTAGQHFAFLGMADEAIAKFNEALDCFARLSDEKERSINLDITRAYLATVTMDARPADARRALSLYLLGDETAPEDALVSKVARLVGERTAKFHHHILLRYIASLPECDMLRKAYGAQTEMWCDPPVGHPWELIEFYRALLLPKGPERESRLETAYRLAATEGGETLMVIAAVIAGAALADGLEGDWPARFEHALAQIAEIPGLKENGRYQALLDQPTAKLPPLELAAKVLPFNFR